MGRAIDLFVTYRFIKLLVTPFKNTDAFKLGIIDENGKRELEPGTNKPTTLRTTEEKSAYSQRCLDLELSWEVMLLRYSFSKIPSKSQWMIQMFLKRNL